MKGSNNIRLTVFPNEGKSETTITPKAVTHHGVYAINQAGNYSLQREQLMSEGIKLLFQSCLFNSLLGREEPNSREQIQINVVTNNLESRQFEKDGSAPVAKQAKMTTKKTVKPNMSYRDPRKIMSKGIISNSIDSSQKASQTSEK